MMLLYFIAMGGALVAVQKRCQKEFDETVKVPLAEQERELDRENERLDRILLGLLREHRSLCEGRSTADPSNMLTEDLEEEFNKLERKH